MKPYKQVVRWFPVRGSEMLNHVAMDFFRMLQRSALICNICFLLALGLFWYKHPVNPGLSSLIIVMGFFLSVILNVVINLWLLYIWIFNKNRKQIPKPLVYINGAFLLIQLTLMLT